MTVAAISESVRNAFIYNPLIRFFNSSEKHEYKSILSASLFLNFLTSLIVIVLVSILAFALGFFVEDLEDFPTMLMIYGVGALAFTFFSHFNFVEQAHLKFGGTLISFVTQKGAFFVYIIAAFIFDLEPSLIELTVAYVTCYIISALISYLTARPYHEFSPKIDFDWVKKLFHYGKFTFGTNSSTMINKNIREWFIFDIEGTKSVGIFSPTVKVTQFLEIPLMAFASVFYPAVVKRVKDEGMKGAKYLYEKSVGLILFSVIPFVLLIYFFAEEIIIFMATDVYADAIPVLQILVFSGLLMPFERQFGITLNAIGKANINFYFIITTSVFSILINYFAILNYGLVGAAYGTLFALIIKVIAVQFILKKHINVNVLNVFKYGFEVFPELMAKIKRR